MSFKMVPFFFFIFLIELTNVQGLSNCTAEGGVCTTRCDADDRIANASCASVGNFCCKAEKRNFAHCNKVNKQCRLLGGRCVPNGRLKDNTCLYLGDPKSCCKGETCCFPPCGKTTLSNCTGVNGTCKTQCLTTEVVVDHGCSHDLCQCCQPCHSKSLCQSYGGVCIANSSTCNEGVVVPNQCTTDNCKCCVVMPSTCPHFKCNDGTVILASKRCDNNTDCADNSDELNCGSTSLCNFMEFTCFNGQIINSNFGCDGHPDCSYGEDEANCDECSTSEFYCRTGFVMIIRSKVCDGNDDCSNGFDEANCGCVQNVSH